MAADNLLLSPLIIAKGIYDFFYFWYIRGTRDYLRKKFGFLKGLEREMGVVINLRMLFQPIYGDYTFAGRLMGPFFRLARFFLGSALLVSCAILFAALLAVRLALPLVAFAMVVANILFLLVG